MLRTDTAGNALPGHTCPRCDSGGPHGDRPCDRQLTPHCWLGVRVTPHLSWWPGALPVQLHLLPALHPQEPFPAPQQLWCYWGHPHAQAEAKPLQSAPPTPPPPLPQRLQMGFNHPPARSWLQLCCTTHGHARPYECLNGKRATGVQTSRLSALDVIWVVFP